MHLLQPSLQTSLGCICIRTCFIIFCRTISSTQKKKKDLFSQCQVRIIFDKICAPPYLISEMCPLIFSSTKRCALLSPAFCVFFFPHFGLVGPRSFYYSLQRDQLLCGSLPIHYHSVVETSFKTCAFFLPSSISSKLQPQLGLFLTNIPSKLRNVILPLQLNFLCKTLFPK